ADSLVFVSTAMRGVKLTQDEQLQLANRLLAAARSLPGVAGATPVISVPLFGWEQHNLYVRGIDSVKTLGRFTMQAGSPDYFRTMGTRILRGRSLSSTDRADAPRVAVVSQSMAAVLWKNENPLGKCFR